MFSLDMAVGGGVALPQLDVPGFVDFPMGGLTLPAEGGVGSMEGGKGSCGCYVKMNLKIKTKKQLKKIRYWLITPTSL